MPDSPDFEAEVFDRITDILMLLSEVTAGDYSTRLELDLPDNHPMTALYRGINETVDSLEAAQGKMLAYQRELEDKLNTIERQRDAIRELSTPIIEVWDSVLCLPIVGVLDSSRSSEITDALLTAVVERRAAYAIIDITGIEVMDTGTADHFLRMVKAVRLLGCACVLTGIAPQIAQTIVHMGVNMEGVTTRRSLRHALQDFVSGRRNSIGA